MNKYKIYKHPIGTIEAVKQGWSWPAFFFASFWAIYKKLWGLGFGVLILSLFIYVALGTSASFFSFADLISLVICFIFGVNGNDWRIANLESRGFDYLETVSASSPDGSIAVHLKNETDPNAKREPFL